MNRLLHVLILLACTGFLSYQVYLNIATYLQCPTATRKSVKTLGQVKLPSIEICLQTGYDLKYLQTQGYEDWGGYLRGVSHGTFIGWAGNSTESSNSLLEKAYVWKNKEDIVKEVTANGNQVDLVELGMQTPEGKCFALDNKNIY